MASSQPSAANISFGEAFTDLLAGPSRGSQQQQPRRNPASRPREQQPRLSTVAAALRKALKEFDPAQGLNWLHRRLAFQPSPLPLAELRAALDDGSYPTAWPALLRAAIPGISLASFGAPTGVEFYLRLLRAMTMVVPRIMFIRQFDGFGQKTERSASTSAAAPHFHWHRKSKHIGVSGWHLCAIQLNRLGLRKQIDVIAESLDASYSLAARFAAAGSKKDDTPLDADEQRLNAELQRMMAADATGPFTFDALKDFVEISRALPHDRAAGVAVAAADFETFDYAKLEKLPRAKELSDNLRRTWDSCENLRTLRDDARKMERITDRVDDVYGTQLPRNGHKVAALAWRGAPTYYSRRCLVGAWIRSQTKCDHKQQAKGGVHVWPEDAWLIGFASLAIYCARFGDDNYHPRSRLSYLPFTNSGRNWDPLGWTAFAHLDHEIRLFKGLEDLSFDTLDHDGIKRIASANAAPQLRWENDHLEFYPASSFVAAVQHERPACAVILKRMAPRFADDALTAAELSMVASGGEPISPGGLNHIQDNGGGLDDGDESDSDDDGG